MRSLIILPALLTLFPFASIDAEIAVFPSSITLRGPEFSQTLIVQQIVEGQTGSQVSEGVAFESSDPKVAEVLEGVVTPRGNGTATIVVRAGDSSAEVRVTVSDFDQPFVWSFRNHVQAVLSKTGCNSGACHGAAAGKNGFYLSLRGYDSDFDFQSLTRQARGRRIIPSDPARSLFLTKPTGRVPHKGGVRFEEGSPEYRVLAEWIAAGQPAPTEDDPRIERLEILPPQIVVSPGVTQQFRVLAHFSDGRTEEVTRWVRFSSTNSTVAEIDERGHAEMKGHGESAIGAGYRGQNATAIVTSPYDNETPAFVFDRQPQANLIDKHVIAKLKQLRLPPSPTASDSMFLRRAFLDTIGVLPTEEESRAFLADSDPDKRNKLIDRLLERPEFVDYWTYRWSDLFLLSGDRLRPKALDAFSQWIREQVEKNTPWDELARQVVLATGNSYENGAVNFYALHQDPFDTAETVSMAFMGMAINCARCHDHPLEKWTNDDYYGMANMFARVRSKGWGGDFRGGDGDRDVYVVEQGELLQPRTGQPQPPRPLDAEPLPFDSTADRRVTLATWLTSDENAYFSHAITNRVWANFMGVGLVENIDDLRLTNPPSNPQLFDELASYLRDQKYDLKSLMRLILQSNAYQRSSTPLPENATDERFYSRYFTRRLKAEVLLDAVSQSLTAPTTFKDYPEGTRALQLRDAAVGSYFLETFGRPERIITCECERSDEPSMVQVLHLVNGDTINEKLAVEKNVIGAALETDTPLGGIVDSAYLRALSRFPTEDERTRILTILSQTPTEETRQSIEDLYWSILSSREFPFQH